MKKSSRWLPKLMGLIILGLVIASLVYAFKPKPALVDFAKIETGTLQVSVSEDGMTRIKERYVVASPLSGRLLRIQLDPGDAVAASETLLAMIEPRDPALLDARALAESEARVKAAEARLKQAEPQLEKTKAAMELAESELARMRKLVNRNTRTQSDLDPLETRFRQTEQDFKTAKFAEEIAQFELETAQAALLRTRPQENSAENGLTNFTLTSPISGRVLRVFQESSKVVTPGENLLEVGDPSDLEIVVDVLSSDAVQVRPGNRVILEHWGGDAELEGIVRLVEPSGFTKVSALGVEEQRVNVIIDFVDSADVRGGLGDGFRVEARMITWEQDEVLIVPTSALFRQESSWAVFKVTDGVARIQTVELGKRNGLQAQVLKGLQAGDRVVVHPGDTVEEGVTVEQR